MKKLAIVALALPLVVGFAVAAQAGDSNASAGQAEPAPGPARSAQPQTGPPRPAPGPAGVAQRPEELAPGPPEPAHRLEQTEEAILPRAIRPRPSRTSRNCTRINRNCTRTVTRSIATCTNGRTTAATSGRIDTSSAGTSKISARMPTPAAQPAADNRPVPVRRRANHRRPSSDGSSSGSQGSSGGGQDSSGPAGLRQHPARFRQSGQRSPDVAKRRPGTARRSAEAPRRLAEAFAATWHPAIRASCNRTCSNSSKTGRPWARSARRPNPIASNSIPTVTTCAEDLTDNQP